MAAQTARKPRQAATPVLADWPRFDTEACSTLLAAVTEAHKAIGPVPRFWTQADLEQLRRIDTEAAEAYEDAVASAHSDHEDAVAAVHKGWRIPEHMLGCGDVEPPRTGALALVGRRVSSTVTLIHGDMPDDVEERAERWAAGETGTGQPEHEERQEDEALDQAQVQP
jgi:hypothetical protein